MSRKRAFTAYYDDDAGELREIDFADGFMAESALMQADVLQDILGSLVEEYNEEVKGLNEWLESLSSEDA